MEFLTWLLHTLHSALGGTKKSGSSVVHQIFQGTMRIMTRKLPPASEVGGVCFVSMETTKHCPAGYFEAVGERRVSGYSALSTPISEFCFSLSLSQKK